MSAECFFDSNVLLYTFDDKDRRKNSIARSLIHASLRDRSGCISYQVAQEVLNVLTRKLDPPASPPDATRFLTAVLEPLWSIQPSPELLRSGLSLQVRYGFSFYDSLIVAAALSAGCSRLLTEDLQHGQRIEGLRIENPFLDS